MIRKDGTEKWSVVDTIFHLPSCDMGEENVLKDRLVVAGDPEYFPIPLDPSMCGVASMQIFPNRSGYLLQTHHVELVQSSQKTVDDGTMVATVPVILDVVAVYAEVHRSLGGSDRDSLFPRPVVPRTVNRAPPFQSI